MSRLAQEAVTFQIRFHNGKDEICDPEQVHYSNNNSYNFSVGELYRVWHSTNTEVHLSTFLVMGQKGTNLTCLKIVHPSPKDVDHRFEKTHGKIKMKPDKPGSYRRSSSRIRAMQEGDEHDAEVFCGYMKHPQCMKENCWIDLSNSWNVNWQNGYEFVYCGVLQEDSITRARDAHLRLYLQHP